MAQQTMQFSENVKLDPSIFTEHGSDSSDTDAEEAKVENNVFYEGIFPMEGI